MSRERGVCGREAVGSDHVQEAIHVVKKRITCEGRRWEGKITGAHVT